MEANGNEFLSPEQLAEYLNLPLGTIYQWRTRGVGPPGMKLGRHVRFRKVDVDMWLALQVDHPRPAA